MTLDTGRVPPRGQPEPAGQRTLLGAGLFLVVVAVVFLTLLFPGTLGPLLLVSVAVGVGVSVRRRRRARRVPEVPLPEFDTAGPDGETPRPKL